MSSPAQRPNILLLLSDEHNASVLGAAGNTIARTPHLDRLAREGVLFENAYCNSPVCGPSRMSFLAGKYASRIGAWDNQAVLPDPALPTLARIVTAAGYGAVLCGKMHLEAGRDYGFRQIGEQSMNVHRKAVRPRRRQASDLASGGEISPRFRDFRTGESSKTLDHDRRVTAGIVEFLQQRRADERPFFLVGGYYAPHFPLIVPRRYWQHFRDKVPPPKIPRGHLESQPRNYQHLRVAFQLDRVPPEKVQQGRELYYGLVEWLDEQMGKVLGALDHSGLAGNTVVIYSSDHGENMGEHGLWWKNCVYDSAARVPLLIRWPERWPVGERRQQVCSLLDLGQTIAGLARAATPRDWNGESLAAVLDHSAAPWKDLAVCEYYGKNIASGYVMCRQENWKYVYHTDAGEQHPAERELYNIADDPGEFCNLAAHTEQRRRIGQLHDALVAEVGEEPEQTERRCRMELKT